MPTTTTTLDRIRGPRIALILVAQWPLAVALFSWSGGPDAAAVVAALAGIAVVAAGPRRVAPAARTVLGAALIGAAHFLAFGQLPIELFGLLLFLTGVFASLCLFGGGRRRTAMLTFGVTVCTAGLTGVELYYHYLKPQPLTVEDRFDGELDEPDQRHTLRYIAGAVGHRKRTLDGELELETFYNIDQDRARAVPGRPALGPKWYFFGCSYTFGFSVSDDQTLPALMQARRPHTRVYNYGVNGYGTADVYLYLRDRVRGQEQLGLCVYFMIDHHLERTACTDALLSSDWGKEKPRFRLDGGRLHHEGRAYETLSPLRRLHVNTLARSHLYRRAHQSLATPWSAGDQVLDLAETLIAGMATACPGRFALVLLPEHVGGATEPIDLKLWQSKLQRRGVLVLDLRERFHEHVAVEGSTASDYFYSDNHPRPRFDQLMANWLDDYLRQNA